MSYLASMLLMNMVEEDAFWALVSLLERPKYLAGFFHRSLDRIQRHAKVFQRLLQHRIPKLCQHLEELGVEPLMFITPWFLTLFTSLPCWDTVLAVWDLIMLDGLNVMFRLGLSILQLLEERLLEMADVSQILPALLRVPADVSRYDVLVPALWGSEVHKWEIDTLQAVVQEEEEDELITGRDTARHKGALPKLGSRAERPGDATKATNKRRANAPHKGERRTGERGALSTALRSAQRRLCEIGRAHRGPPADCKAAAPSVAPARRPGHGSSAVTYSKGRGVKVGYRQQGSWGGAKGRKMVLLRAGSGHTRRHTIHTPLSPFSSTTSGEADSSVAELKGAVGPGVGIKDAGTETQDYKEGSGSENPSAGVYHARKAMSRLAVGGPYTDSEPAEAPENP
ncbi:uncharacterized protein LOC116939867 [Petromyzon marinus]|uniref:uncharacterized protein LOC116939867 n=1 Tax=Petromyzon marinus TaxID=7757 RepID=UPI003F727945